MINTYTPGEEKDIQELIRVMKDYLKQEYPEGKILRNFHPKMHGLLKGTLTIRQDIPEALQVGLFKEARQYDVWIRLSNAPPKVRSDKPASGRGLAIKVLQVKGEMIEEDPIGCSTQNFLMTTSPILSTWTIRLYKKAIKAVLFGLWEQLRFAINPSHWRSIYLTLKYSAKHDNLLSQTYFSGGAFRHGPDHFVKFVLTPNNPALGYTLAEPRSENFLKEQLKEDCQEREHAFTLNVQIHKDEKEQPLENTSKVWKAGLVPLASLNIPKQDFDTEERRAMGEKMEFSPWIGLEDHTPVGGINRARRRVYKELAAFRKSL
ncbi:catalase family protein [Cyclobacterium plantarum]|uniref:Catalase n=1 Tax=Cyclobacterium plantarum TaxID=2716263 RepID=A0ABX0H6S1_9BACT|nr:catalase [Cyclobacterium plantarum]NHE56588.1 catalase [Cyclobacterium plantarum]